MEDNIKTGLKEIGFEGMRWIHVTVFRNHWRVLLNTEMNLRLP
jgi:hypothetical protein